MKLYVLLCVLLNMSRTEGEGSTGGDIAQVKVSSQGQSQGQGHRAVPASRDLCFSWGQGHRPAEILLSVMQGYVQQVEPGFCGDPALF